ALIVRRNGKPRMGMSPRSGILRTVSVRWVSINPPITTVWALGVTTTVSAERLAMTGALALLEMGTVWSVSVEISGATIISTVPSEVMNGVTRRMMPTLSYWMVLIVSPVSVIRLFVMKGTSE